MFQFARRTRRQVRNDFDEELSLHRDLRIAELTTRGLTRRQAAEIADNEFGDVEDARRYVYAEDRAAEFNERQRELMHEIWYDLQTVVRRLRRSPLFTGTALFTLTLGIGACVLMFNIVSAVLLSPLPYKAADRVMMIWGDVRRSIWDSPSCRSLGATSRTFAITPTRFSQSPRFVRRRSTSNPARRLSASTASRQRETSSMRLACLRPRADSSRAITSWRVTIASW
jgi:hypothetical protein